MPGFFITNTQKTPKLNDRYSENCICGNMIVSGWNIQWNVLNKYQNDKIFGELDNKVIILDGVILNSNELIRKYAAESWNDCVLKMSRHSVSWFSELRGSFSGAVFEKDTDTWTCFTDQCGGHLLMTYSKDGNIAMGSQVDYFSDWMRLNSINRNINEDWQSDILTYGGMRDAHTIIDGVYRVYPGYYCVLNSTTFEFVEKPYYLLSKKNQTNLSDEEIIDKLDKLFTAAIQRVIDKDQDYGYQTIVDVSGGLDSRINAAVAARIAPEYSLLGITYAQRHSDDQKVADKVAKQLKMEHLFYPMDDGVCLEDIDPLVELNGGLNYYYGITGGKRILEKLDSRRMGMEIWGLLGDMYESTYNTYSLKEDPEGNAPPQWITNVYRASRRFTVDSIPKSRHTFEDNELMWFYIRGMLVGMNTGLIRQHFVEPYSPFGDVEFMDFYFSIPYKKRTVEHICRKWMISKYPAMARIPYARTGLPVTVSKLGEVLSKPRYLFRGICHHIFGIQKKEWLMNPIELWYNDNKHLKNTISQYYIDNISVLEETGTLKDRVSELYNQGNISEKLLAITVLAAVKFYID